MVRAAAARSKSVSIHGPMGLKVSRVLGPPQGAVLGLPAALTHVVTDGVAEQAVEGIVRREMSGLACPPRTPARLRIPRVRWRLRVALDGLPDARSARSAERYPTSGFSWKHWAPRLAVLRAAMMHVLGVVEPDAIEVRREQPARSQAASLRCGIARAGSHDGRRRECLRRPRRSRPASTDRRNGSSP